MRPGIELTADQKPLAIGDESRRLRIVETRGRQAASTPARLQGRRGQTYRLSLDVPFEVLGIEGGKELPREAGRPADRGDDPARRPRVDRHDADGEAGQTREVTDRTTKGRRARRRRRSRRSRRQHEHQEVSRCVRRCGLRQLDRERSFRPTGRAGGRMREARRRSACVPVSPSARAASRAPKTAAATADRSFLCDLRDFVVQIVDSDSGTRASVLGELGGDLSRSGLVKPLVTAAIAGALVVGCALQAAAQAAPKPAARAGVLKTAFGQTKEGVPVDLYTLTNRRGMIAKVMTYGATLTDLIVPDRAGKPGDVVLGFDKLEPYLAGVPYFGSTVGRVGNRIAKGRFTLDGKTYTLATNNGPNHLHGGLKGFDKVVWKAETVPGAGGDVGEVHLSQPGRRGRLPGQPRRDRGLHAHRRERAAARLHGDDRQGDAGQPHQPQLLQPGRRRQRRHPRPRADDRGRPVHAGRRHADPDRRAEAGEGHALRLHHADRDRRAHRQGADRAAGRATTTTSCSARRPARRGRRWRRGCTSRRAAGSWRC